MKTILHLCRKDFRYARHWLAAAWLLFIVCGILPFIAPAGDAALPFMLIAKFLPPVIIFVVTIASCLVLPAVVIAVISANMIGIQASAVKWLAFSAETMFFLTVPATAALMASALGNRYGFPVLLAFLFVLIYFGRESFRGRISLEMPLHQESALIESQWIATKYLSIACLLLVSFIWTGFRRTSISIITILLSLTALSCFTEIWQWNFVAHLTKKNPAEVFREKPSIRWTGEPHLSSNNHREGIEYSRLTRQGHLEGLKKGWYSELSKFHSEARFKNGRVWKSDAYASFQFPVTNEYLEALKITGVTIGEKYFTLKPSPWKIFECEKRRFSGVDERTAKIDGRGVFELWKPVIVADLPTQNGATAINGRFQYRIDEVRTDSHNIHLKLSIRGLALEILGDHLPPRRGSGVVIFVNHKTGESTSCSFSGGSTGADPGWTNYRRSFSLNPTTDPSTQSTPAEFLKGAKLYIISKEYGGNITLPYSLEEIELREND